MSQDPRKLSDLRAWLKAAFPEHPPNTIKWSDSLSKYISGGRLGQDNFVTKLGTKEGFVHDGMSINVASLPTNPTINRLLVAIVLEYQARGQEVIL